MHSLQQSLRRYLLTQDISNLCKNFLVVRLLVMAKHLNVSRLDRVGTRMAIARHTAMGTAM